MNLKKHVGMQCTPNTTLWLILELLHTRFVTSNILVLCFHGKVSMAQLNHKQSDNVKVICAASCGGSA